jgi:glyoxylase-like metal-dependent hydrolase (beta-lactamase superfamily II)
VRFYARVNYQAELERIARVRVPFRYFFGDRFDLGAAIDFQAHETVSVRRQIVVGETPIELIPVEGGETEDGLFIHFPRERVLFTGDFIMPYLGAPFVEEGNLGGLLAAIDMVTALDPAFILHGHEPLTRVYGAATTLADLRVALSWLETEIRRGLREGATRAEIHRRNLIAPNVPQNPPVQVPYLVMREHVIDRIYDQTIGYWHPDLDGMDHLSPREWGAVLSQYLGIDESKLEGAVKDMISSGDAQAAARLVEWYSAYAPESERLRALRRAVYRHLAGKYQEIDPFRFIIYSERAGQEMRQLNQP